MRRKLHGLTPPGIFRRFASTAYDTPHNTTLSSCGTPHTTTTTNKKGSNMKIEIDWLEMAKAVAKAVWPFVAGAFGGLFSGCTFGGIGPIFV